MVPILPTRNSYPALLHLVAPGAPGSSSLPRTRELHPEGPEGGYSALRMGASGSRAATPTSRLWLRLLAATPVAPIEREFCSSRPLLAWQSILSDSLARCIRESGALARSLPTRHYRSLVPLLKERHSVRPERPNAAPVRRPPSHTGYRWAGEDRHQADTTRSSPTP